MTYFPRAALIIGTPGIFLYMLEWHCSTAARGEKNTPDPSFEVAVVCRHDVNSMLHGTLNQTVICICTLMITAQSLEPRVFRNAQGQSVFRPQLFQLCKHTVGDNRDAFRIKTVHHRRNHFELIVDRERYEVGIA